MQQFSPGIAPAPMAAAAIPLASDFTPHAMAHYLRCTGGSAARCFAEAMHADAAWANERWGEYWADVIRLV